ncbi:MAG: exodeoxyribonuclease VII small subunit [Candidatus Omnitrophica bacterium]|nr:exodeoxyribonuclease VII small subunit [Candidatus Omnitrophota bacterium]
MPEKKAKKTVDVAKAFTELESIAEWFEKGESDLDVGLKKYERAMELAEVLRERLEQAENKVTEIQKKHSK